MLEVSFIQGWFTAFYAWISNAYFELEFLSEFIDSFVLIEVLIRVAGDCTVEVPERNVSLGSLQDSIQKSRIVVTPSLLILEPSFCDDSSGFGFRQLLDYEDTRVQVADCLPSITGLIYSGATTVLLSYAFDLVNSLYDRKDQGKLEEDRQYINTILDSLSPVDELYAFLGLENVDEILNALGNLVDNFENVDFGQIVEDLRRLYELAEALCIFGNFCDELENYTWIQTLNEDEVELLLRTAVKSSNSVRGFKTDFEMFMSKNMDIIDTLIDELKEQTYYTVNSVFRNPRSDAIDVLNRINETSGLTCAKTVSIIQEKNHLARNNATNASTLVEFIKDNIIDLGILDECFYENLVPVPDGSRYETAIAVYDNKNNVELRRKINTYNYETSRIQEANRSNEECFNNKILASTEKFLIVWYVLAFVFWVVYAATTCKCFEKMASNTKYVRMFLGIIIQILLGVLVVVPLVDLYQSENNNIIDDDRNPLFGIIIASLVVSFIVKILSIIGYVRDKKRELENLDDENHQSDKDQSDKGNHSENHDDSSSGSSSKDDENVLAGEGKTEKFIHNSKLENTDENDKRQNSIEKANHKGNNDVNEHTKTDAKKEGMPTGNVGSNSDLKETIIEELNEPTQTTMSPS